METKESEAIRRYSKIERLEILDAMLSQGEWVTFGDVWMELDKYCNRLQKLDLETAYGSTFRSDIRIIRTILKDPLNQLDPDMLETKGSKRQMSYRYKIKGFSIIPYLEYQYTAADYKKLDRALKTIKENLPDNVYENLYFTVRSRVEYDYSKGEVTVDYSENLGLTGRRWLSVLYQAICKTVLAITYKTYDGFSETYHLHPYLLKLFNERWFLFGFRPDKNASYWNVPLDRIENITLLPAMELKPRPDHYMKRFDGLIGVTYNPRRELMLDKTSPELIIIGFHNRHAWGRSITKPIHPSQKIIKEFADGYGEMSILVVPNNEMFTRILSLGEFVSIVGPDHIRKGMQSMLAILNKRYTDE